MPMDGTPGIHGIRTIRATRDTQPDFYTLQFSSTTRMNLLSNSFEFQVGDISTAD